MEELPEQLKDSIIVPIYKKNDKRDCSKDRGILMSHTKYKILSKILFQG